MDTARHQKAPIFLLPADPIVSIDHPCIIQNIDRGLKSLGGAVVVDKFLDDSLSNEAASIDATMRPDDILAKGIQSRPVKTDNVLLRVTVPRRTGRKRKKGSNEPYTKAPDWNPKAPFPVDGKELLRILQDNPDKHTITAIGNITGTHRFRQLPDYQWTTSSDSMMENLRETILSGDFNKLKKFKLDPSQQLAPGVELGAPPKFGFTKTPIPYMYRQNMYVKVVTGEDGIARYENVHLPRSHINHVVELDAETIPSESPVPLKPEKELHPKFRLLIRRMRAELEKRPVMVRRVQKNITGARGGDEKHCWAYLGYTFRGGPFKDALIKFGVDPRSDPKYREYQTFTLQIPDIVPRGKMARPVDRTAIKFAGMDTHIFDGTEWFDDGKVFQLCDVTDPLLRGIIEKAPPVEDFDPTVCGWYANGTYCLIRSIMRDKVLRLKANNPRAENFYDEMVAVWKDHMTPANSDTTHLSKTADIELIELASSTRGKAMQTHRDMQRYRNKIRRERGEEIEEEDVVEMPQNDGDDASESDDEMEMDEDEDEDSDELEIGAEEDENEEDEYD